MSTVDDQIADYLGSLSGPDRDDAFHRLIELGAVVIPYLEQAFTNAVDARTRQTLVTIAWQTRSRQSLPFLQHALEDASGDVWKEALDGLVAIGGPEALDLVQRMRSRTTSDKRQWFDEAIQQITENL